MTPAETEFVRQAIAEMRRQVLRDVLEAVKATRTMIGWKHSASDAIGILEVELQRKISV